MKAGFFYRLFSVISFNIFVLMDELKLSRKLNFLYTNIGRGHPFYLDGINEALIRKGQIKLVRNHTDVFELSKGLSKLGWKLIRYLYQEGSQDGMISRFYNHLRQNSDYNKNSLIKNILARDIVKKFDGSDDPVIVAHPLLASMLRGKVELLYQHGELIAPEEAIVRGIDYVFVPTEPVAEKFIQAGYNKDQIIQTGICIEPPLVRMAEDCYKARLDRLCGQEPLCGAYFSSGAEPKRHVDKLLKTLWSSLNAGHKAILFAKANGRLYQEAMAFFLKHNLDFGVIMSSELIPHELPQLSLVVYQSRREENSFTAKLFKAFDFLVMPAHERTNWAMGLGLPSFILTPNIGPFAPMNAKLMLDKGVAITVDDNIIDDYGNHLSELRQNGEIQQMAQKGWGEKIDGFAAIADFLGAKYSTGLL